MLVRLGPAMHKASKHSINGYSLSVGKDINNIDAFYDLRERVFAQELNWVSASANGREIDEFDAHSIHVTVTHNAAAAGYLRLTPYGRPWMLTERFKFLLEQEELHNLQRNSLEISRLAVSSQYRGQAILDEFGVFDLLIKGITLHALENGVRYWYVVVSAKIHRLLLSKGLPCERVGPTVLMPDGVKTLAARIDVELFSHYADRFYREQSSASAALLGQGIYAPRQPAPRSLSL